MIRVALTGSIGAGKSTLLEAARAEEYPVFDADATVHRLYSENGDLIKEIGNNFPGTVSGGIVDRAALAKLVYAGDMREVKRTAAELRRIVSPYVRREMNSFFAATEAKAGLAVCEIPFLFESGLYREFDLTVNLAVSENVQRARVLERDKGKGMDPALLEKIRGLFFSDSIRERLADISLDADAAPDVLSRRFLAILKDAAARPAERPDLKQRPPLVWLVGATSSGKTSMAQKGLVPLGFQTITGSAFFRASFGKQETDYLEGKPLESFSKEEIAALKQKFVADLAAHSITVLQNNPHGNIDYVNATIRQANGPCVLEGFRNPYEFMQLYDPAKDMVIFLNRRNAPAYDTVFERGIKTIEQNVRWCVNASLAPAGTVYDITFGNSRIEASRIEKNGPVTIPMPRQSESMDDYALIDEATAMVSRLVADHYASGEWLPRPGQPRTVPQRHLDP